MKNKISLLSLALIAATLAGFSGPVEANWFEKELKKYAKKYGEECYNYCNEHHKLTSISSAESCMKGCSKHDVNHAINGGGASSSTDTDACTDTDASTDTTDSSGQ